MKFKELSKFWKRIVITLSVLTILLTLIFDGMVAFMGNMRSENEAKRNLSKKPDSELIGQRSVIERKGKGDIHANLYIPDTASSEKLPVLFNAHGGGFFSGSKNMGDPLAATEATALLDDICAAGYNIVNVDYALVPDYHFPVPLIQANRAFAYMQEHAEEYHFNMNNVVIMGSSAGAIMASQLGSIITNPEYADLLGITPTLKPEQIMAVILDDAPLDYEKFDFSTKILVGNYVKGSIYLSKDEIKKIQQY